MQSIGRQHVLADERQQRRQDCGAGADPAAQGRNVEVDALQGIALALPVQRQVLAKLRLQDHRQQLGPGPAPGDRVERCRWLGDGLAGAAAELLPHRLDDLLLPRDHLQRLGDRLTELDQPAVAAGTGGRTRDHHALAR